MTEAPLANVPPQGRLQEQDATLQLELVYEPSKLPLEQILVSLVQLDPQPTELAE